MPNRRRSNPPNTFGLLTITIFIQKPPSIFYQRNACQHQGRRDKYQDEFGRTNRGDKQPGPKSRTMAASTATSSISHNNTVPSPDVSRAIRAYNISIFGNGEMVLIF